MENGADRSRKHFAIYSDTLPVWDCKALKEGEQQMNEKHRATVENWANYVRNSNPEAIGVAFLAFDCGCLQGGPFNLNGDQAGPINHLGQVAEGEVKLCQACISDGGSPSRSAESFLLFFQPCNLTEEERDQMGAKIFCDSPTAPHGQEE